MKKIGLILVIIAISATIFYCFIHYIKKRTKNRSENRKAKLHTPKTDNKAIIGKIRIPNNLIIDIVFLILLFDLVYKLFVGT